MQHIKNNLIWIKNIIINILNLFTLQNKVINNIKIIGPSLSILKPEITAIFSILNRIIGIFLLLIIFVIFLPIIIKHLNVFSFFYYNILISCMFFFFFHIVYNRLKLTLYYNKIYLFINKNIIIINNYIFIYLILILILIFCNLILLVLLHYIFFDIELFLLQDYVFIKKHNYFISIHDLSILVFNNKGYDFIVIIIFFFIKYQICSRFFNIILKKNQYLFALKNYTQILKKKLILFKNNLIWLYWELFKEINIIYICKWKYKLYFIYIYCKIFFSKIKNIK